MSFAPPRRAPRGVVVALCLALSVVLVVSGPGRVEAAEPATVIGITSLALSAGGLATALVALPDDKPEIHIEEFSLAVPEDFNVGDSATVNLLFAVSYGGIADSLSGEEVGGLTVRFYADGKVLDQRTTTHDGDLGIKESYTLKTSVIGVRPGSSEVHAEIEVRGQIAGFIRDDPRTVKRDTATRVLNVREPYDVWIDEPEPAEVLHGNPTTARLMVRVRTEDYGEGFGLVLEPTQLDGQSFRHQDVVLGGAANAGATYEKVLIEREKRHRGCPHRPPHPSFMNLRFEPNRYHLSTRFSKFPYTYDQVGELRSVSAKDHPYDPPVCGEGEAYDPNVCDCVKTVSRGPDQPPVPSPPPWAVETPGAAGADVAFGGGYVADWHENLDNTSVETRSRSFGPGGEEASVLLPGDVDLNNRKFDFEAHLSGPILQAPVALPEFSLGATTVYPSVIFEAGVADVELELHDSSPPQLATSLEGTGPLFGLWLDLTAPLGTEGRWFTGAGLRSRIVPQMDVDRTPAFDGPGFQVLEDDVDLQWTSHAAYARLGYDFGRVAPYVGVSGQQTKIEVDDHLQIAHDFGQSLGLDTRSEFESETLAAVVGLDARLGGPFFARAEAAFGDDSAALLKITFIPELLDGWWGPPGLGDRCESDSELTSDREHIDVAIADSYGSAEDRVELAKKYRKQIQAEGTEFSIATPVATSYTFYREGLVGGGGNALAKTIQLKEEGGTEVVWATEKLESEASGKAQIRIQIEAPEECTTRITEATLLLVDTRAEIFDPLEDAEEAAEVARDFANAAKDLGEEVLKEVPLLGRLVEWLEEESDPTAFVDMGAEASLRIKADDCRQQKVRVRSTAQLVRQGEDTKKLDKLDVDLDYDIDSCSVPARGLEIGLEAEGSLTARAEGTGLGENFLGSLLANLWVSCCRCPRQPDGAASNTGMGFSVAGFFDGEDKNENKLSQARQKLEAKLDEVEGELQNATLDPCDAEAMRRRLEKALEEWIREFAEEEALYRGTDLNPDEE